MTVTNLDGRTATRNAAFTVSAAPPRLTLTYVGMLRDRVSRSNTILGPDGALDGAFQLALEPGSNSRTVTRLDLRRSGTTNLWDTNPGTAAWIIGVSASLDSVLLNSSTGAIETALADGSSLSIFAANPSPSAFVGGAVFVLTVQFADGTSASASVTIQP